MIYEGGNISCSPIQGSKRGGIFTPGCAWGYLRHGLSGLIRFPNPRLDRDLWGATFGYGAQA